jgi:ubiquitin-activating enzyme E1
MENTIDESLYSRQLYAFGDGAIEAMKNMNNTSVLISGMCGVGIEIAKCIILSGVKSVILHDTKNLCINDMSSNYYMSEKNCGENRAKFLSEYFKELNSYVTIKYDNCKLNENHFIKNNIIVICDDLLIKQIYFNKIARKHKTKFIVANTFGLYGYIFCDFGDNFFTNDSDGETLKNGIIINCKENIYNTNEPHELSVGDYIDITIGKEKYENNISKIIDLTTFQTEIKINNINTNTGTFIQKKNKVNIPFKSLDKIINEPEFTNVISNDCERQMFLHTFNICLEIFISKKNTYPDFNNKNDIEIIFNLFSNNYSKYYENKDKIDNIINKLLITISGRICVLDSIIGSVTAQEIIKASSNKFTPIKQFFYHDVLDILPEKIDMTDYNNIISNRYSRQTRVLGKSLNEKIKHSNIFVVGAGAIGSEHMKNISMLGVKNVIITDMDTIEKSNLNRQFLFRNSDLGKFKSECIKQAIKKMNPDVTVIAHTNKVSEETLPIYSSNFFNKLTCVMTALDNIQARKFVDKLCLNNTTALFDCGTLGTKGNVQCIIPNMTESYSSSSDPEEKQIPICTLKSFPYMIEHCIQWARELFDEYFVKIPYNYNKYIKMILNNENTNLIIPSELNELYTSVNNVIKYFPYNSLKCVKFAYELWYQQFRDQIYHLTCKFPEDYMTTENIPFWTGTKKYPNYFKFDLDNKLHFEFIHSVCNLWSDVFEINRLENNEIYNNLKLMTEPDISSIKGEIQITENKQDSTDTNDISYTEPIPVLMDEYFKITLKSLEFEKDDPTNFHIDFITSASNMRATNYQIKTADKFKTKGISGKIIPALITTTSLISSLTIIEMIKYVNSTNFIEKYINSFVNLALPIFCYSEPVSVTKSKVGNYEFSIWDKIVLNNPTILEIMTQVTDKINSTDDKYKISGISIDSLLIFSSVLSKKKQQEKSIMLIKDVYAISKKILPEELKNLKEINVSVFTELINNNLSNDEKENDTIYVKILF